jgi:hypothetical protein
MGFKEYKKQINEVSSNNVEKTNKFNELLNDVTRIEVIDNETGRSYVNNKKTNHVSLSIQDNGKTLKVFVQSRYEENQ